MVNDLFLHRQYIGEILRFTRKVPSTAQIAQGTYFSKYFPLRSFICTQSCFVQLFLQKRQRVTIVIFTRKSVKMKIYNIEFQVVTVTLFNPCYLFRKNEGNVCIVVT